MAALAATAGTSYARLHHAAGLLTVVLPPLCHGYPLQAIVAAFGPGERTTARWQTRAGDHCQQVHQHPVPAGQVALGHVQADKLWSKLVGKRV